MSWIGRPVPRLEDPVLVRGEGSFVADGAANAKAIRFVRSPVACGKIIKIERPKDAWIITAADLEGVKPICPILHRRDYVPVSQPILATDRIKYVGEPIAAVIADTPELAEDIAENVFVDIDPGEPVVDVDQALEANAALVHDNAPGNILVDGIIKTDGADDAFQNASQVVEVDIRSRRQAALPLETRGAYASYDCTSQRVTLRVSAQMPHMLRTGLADVLGIPEVDLRVIAPDVGGAFGQKMPLVPEYVVTVWAALHFKGAFAWIEDRRENLMASCHSRDQHYLVRGAFDVDGQLIAIDADLRCNVGAYSCYPFTCGVEPLMAMAELPGPYNFQEYKVRARGVTTNTCPMAPYRGVSRPVMTLTMERLMDEAADRFGISKPEIRHRNLISEFPYRSATGLIYDEGSYRKALELAEIAADMGSFRREQETARTERRYLGIGFSVFSERTGYGTPAFAARSMGITPGYERVDITMDPSGFIEARIGASPHGQGLRTTLSQIISDELGVPMENIRISHGDTDKTPYGWGTFASRSIVISGGACKLAAGQLRERLKLFAGQLLQVGSQDVIIADGQARVERSGAVISVKEIARQAHHQSHQFGEDAADGLSVSATYDPAGTFSNACHVAIVEVDVETGAVELQRFIVVEDAGRLINPMIVEGQIHGGVAQGIASALFEEIIYDQDGNILTTTLADFLPPTSAEVPDIEIHHLETITDATVSGAKGVGEGGTIGATAAVINAISDALSPLGISLFEMPATPQRIRALIKESGHDEQD